MDGGIAIVGMACIYPDARSPRELWRNALGQRRSFRRIPRERLRLEDYFSTDRAASDSVYSTEAALISDYDFDRLRFKVVGSTFRSADLAHWLALDVASMALADAGFPDATGLPREETAVILGNTLTGEFSRANTLRLRWPYVRRVVYAELVRQGWTEADSRAFVTDLETSYKAPFPVPGEETLAGGLSNTIAGRVCNHFDLKGGGYTVDGACAASLLAVTNACAALRDGDVSVALAGGVDLSLDPFELVGFARTAALAPELMRIYDAQSAGFWPGEGCGVIVLMREADAVAQDRRVYAVIRGWGISSDGSGGITRPEVGGQKIALRRAYRRAGFGPDRITYFEGHGTGTAVGDATELRVLSEIRREAGAAVPAAIGSIKANIGHTKAAAGVAGLIKSVMALGDRIVPPTTGCMTPHPELGGPRPALRILRRPEAWPEDAPRCAAVSAMGFGGINTHVVLEAFGSQVSASVSSNRHSSSARSSSESSAALPDYRSQDAELFLFAADDSAGLRAALDTLLNRAAELSRAELTDAAALCARQAGKGVWRAALVAASPAQLASRLGLLIAFIDAGETERFQPADGVFLSQRPSAGRIGFLFPGQGSPVSLTGGVFRDRFSEVENIYGRAQLPGEWDGVSTLVAQPAIVTATIGALRVLRALGIEASSAVGHSLGELSALHWAGALDADELLNLARARGRAMSELGSPTGAMAGLRTDEATVRSIMDELGSAEADAPLKRDGGASSLEELTIAGLNSPRQTVISGPAEAVDRVIAIAVNRGMGAIRLPVSHAFHSPLVAAAAPALRAHLDTIALEPLNRSVMSTITGDRLDEHADLRELLCRQLTSPVRFIEAAQRAFSDCDLLIEVGPGDVLTGLSTDLFDTQPIISVEAGGPSVAPLLAAVAAAFAIGVDIQSERLFRDRLVRDIDLSRRPAFFANPCESAPASEGDSPSAVADSRNAGQSKTRSAEPGLDSDADRSMLPPVELVRRLVAQRTELPTETVSDGHRLLKDLHLNSISVGQIVADAARILGLPNPVAPTAFANATVAELAAALETWTSQTSRQPSPSRAGRAVAGAEAWIRPMTVQWEPQALYVSHHSEPGGGWRVIASPDHPLAEKLMAALARSASGGGVALLMPIAPDESCVPLMLHAVRAVVSGSESKFIVVQQGVGAAGLAKTLHLEHPAVDVAVIDLPFDHDSAVDWVVSESVAVSGFTEVWYDRSGVRRIPRLMPLITTESADPAAPLSERDVVLISGGGKGIAAECAVDLARRYGVGIAVMGRSDPSVDADVRATLSRLQAIGRPHCYVRADVSVGDDVRRAVETAVTTLGPVTAFFHAAGINEPCLLDALDEASFLRTVRPKVTGLKNVLAALDANRLRLLVSFGSIIAQAGMPGEADYAVANDWLAAATEAWGRDHAPCRCLTIDWSVWQSVGMGPRLGRVEALMQQGITPIPTDEGLRQLRRLLEDRVAAARVIVGGRFGSPPTLGVRQTPLPLMRFVERSLVDYPGVELVVDAEVTQSTDPYVTEHALHGESLFPAVMGLEAMAQAAAALVGASDAPTVMRDITFHRPIVVPTDRGATLRMAALVNEDGSAGVVLRSSATDFQADYFRANFEFPSADAVMAAPRPLDIPLGTNGRGLILMDRDTELYGDMLFHDGRFRRVRGYRGLMARRCLAELTPVQREDWFASYLPPALLLGDAAARDAAIHAIQSCIPHARLLPVSVQRIERYAPYSSPARSIRAVETSHEGETFTYDMQILDESSLVLEAWTGLRLRVLEPITRKGGWNSALLANYVERRVSELLPATMIGVAIEESPATEREGRSDHAIGTALGGITPVVRRADGKPELDNGHHVSASHAGEYTMAVASTGRTGCDIEPISERDSADWASLLGAEGFSLASVLSERAGEPFTRAATRVWTAMESLLKAGAPANGMLSLETTTSDGWAVLRCGGYRAATLVVALGARNQSVALSVLSGDGL